jgi:hypothetical protein
MAYCRLSLLPAGALALAPLLLAPGCVSLLPEPPKASATPPAQATAEDCRALNTRFRAHAITAALSGMLAMGSGIAAGQTSGNTKIVFSVTGAIFGVSGALNGALGALAASSYVKRCTVNTGGR